MAQATIFINNLNSMTSRDEVPYEVSNDVQCIGDTLF